MTLKQLEFSDYVTPDKALADGDIQLNAYQHVPFMENFNKQNGSKFSSYWQNYFDANGFIQ